MIENGWYYSRNGYVEVHSVTDQLKPGYYFADTNSNGQLVMMPKEMRSMSAFGMPGDQPSQFLGKIEKFFKDAATYEAMGMSHKMGLILFGEPGIGKTTTLQKVVDWTTNVVGGLVVRMPLNTDMVSKILGAVSLRPVIFLCEDLDRFCQNGYEEEICEILDGLTSPNNVVFLATTNYINKVPKRLLRHGRFGDRFELKSPDAKWRQAYLETRLGPINRLDLVEPLVIKTDGYKLCEIDAALLEAL